jgi:dynein light chain Tctex-type 1
VIEQAMTRFKAQQQPFKYIVTCVIMQKNGAGMHMATSCFWDNSSDGSATLKWDNKTLHCIATVFGLAI